MARQILSLLKYVPGVDGDLDQTVNAVESAADMLTIASKHESGRGLLYWSSWYDPWSMGNDVAPDEWPFPIQAIRLCDDVWELPLDADWSAIATDSSQSGQWPEQQRLSWQFSHACSAYQMHNDAARLMFGRKVLGASLDDTEIA